MPSSSLEQTLALAYLYNTLSKEEGKKSKIKIYVHRLGSYIYINRYIDIIRNG